MSGGQFFSIFLFGENFVRKINLGLKSELGKKKNYFVVFMPCEAENFN